MEPLDPSEYKILDRCLGRGSFSVVYEGIDMKTNELLAIKIINKRNMTNIQKVQLINEINVLEQLKNVDHVVQLVDVKEDECNKYIIMKKIEGQELYDLCMKYPAGMPEDVCKPLFRQILTVIDAIHSRNVVHLDLKLENIMYNPRDRSITVIDFGFAQQWEDGEYINHFCGSVHYTPPEIIRKESYNGPKADIWSLGIIFYAIICAHFPYDHHSENYNIIFNKVLNEPLVFTKKMSEQAKHFLQLMLEKDPEVRATMEQLLVHSFLE
jgi:serine/threonine protein kinase